MITAVTSPQLVTDFLTDQRKTTVTFWFMKEL